VVEAAMSQQREDQQREDQQRNPNSKGRRNLNPTTLLARATAWLRLVRELTLTLLVLAAVAGTVFLLARGDPQAALKQVGDLLKQLAG